jgi:hypothetical protein
MIALSAFAAAGEGGVVALAVTTAAGVALVAAAGLFMRYAAEPLLSRIAREPELLVITAIAWASLWAAAADLVGLSKELGGLIAGVSLGSTSVREAVAARLAPLRDFLLLFFFLELGALFDFSAVAGRLGEAAVLSLFVLVGNPLIVMAIMGVMGYRRRTGFLAGLTVAQISEFSLVFVALGRELGHIGAEAVGLTTLVGIVTIGLSTYTIVNSATLYRWLGPWLGLFERRHPFGEDQVPDAAEARPCEVILFGLGRYGTAIAEGLAARGIGFLGVDFDPEAVRAFRRRGWPAVYGDAARGAGARPCRDARGPDRRLARGRVHRPRGADGHDRRGGAGAARARRRPRSQPLCRCREGGGRSARNRPRRRPHPCGRHRSAIAWLAPCH